MMPERRMPVGMSRCGSMHLVAGARAELEADEQEHDGADHGEEAADRGDVGAPGGDAVRDAVLGQAGDHEDHEQGDGEGLDHRADVGRPLAVLEGGHGDRDVHPHEHEADDDRPQRPDRLVAVRHQEEVVDRGDGDRRQRPADPERVGDPVLDGGERRRQLAERHAHPRVDAALGRERRAELRVHEAVRQQEDEDEDQQPDQGLAQPPARERGDRVEADDGADAEEHEVPASECLGELDLPLWFLDLGHEATHPFPMTALWWCRVRSPSAPRGEQRHPTEGQGC